MKIWVLAPPARPNDLGAAAKQAGLLRGRQMAPLAEEEEEEDVKSRAATGYFLIYAATNGQ